MVKYNFAHLLVYGTVDTLKWTDSTTHDDCVFYISSADEFRLRLNEQTFIFRK